MQEECRATITDELRWLESQADPAGPHFLGAQFSLVDAVRPRAGIYAVKTASACCWVCARHCCACTCQARRWIRAPIDIADRFACYRGST